MSYYFGNSVIVIILLISIIAISIIIERTFIFFQFNSFRKIIKFMGDNNEKNNILKNYYHINFISQYQSIVDEIGIMDHRSVLENKKLDNKIEVFLERIDLFLEVRLNWLKIVSVVSPTLGILGTVFGMISAFSGFVEQKIYGNDVFITGILQALYSTAFGLTLSIVCIFFFGYFTKKIDSIKGYFYFNFKDMLYGDRK